MHIANENGGNRSGICSIKGKLLKRENSENRNGLFPNMSSFLYSSFHDAEGRFLVDSLACKKYFYFTLLMWHAIIKTKKIISVVNEFFDKVKRKNILPKTDAIPSSDSTYR